MPVQPAILHLIKTIDQQNVPNEIRIRETFRINSIVYDVFYGNGNIFFATEIKPAVQDLSRTFCFR